MSDPIQSFFSVNSGPSAMVSESAKGVTFRNADGTLRASIPDPATGDQEQIGTGGGSVPTNVILSDGSVAMIAPLTLSDGGTAISSNQLAQTTGALNLTGAGGVVVQGNWPDYTIVGGLTSHFTGDFSTHPPTSDSYAGSALTLPVGGTFRFSIFLTNAYNGSYEPDLVLRLTGGNPTQTYLIPIVPGFVTNGALYSEITVGSSINGTANVFEWVTLYNTVTTPPGFASMSPLNGACYFDIGAVGSALSNILNQNTAPGSSNSFSFDLVDSKAMITGTGSTLTGTIKVYSY